MPERGTVSGFIERHQWPWEGAMAALAVAYLALGFVADSGSAAVPWAIVASPLCSSVG